ncbi:MAG: hypothetical protein IKI71_01760 [Lachnospiraceae bacterium]|nr:hypothetical protein [Lachnospiraceae bacterium]
MKNKIIVLAITIMLFVLAMFDLGFCRGRWIKSGDNWKYETKEGTGNYVYEKWRTILDDGVTEKVYYFDYYGNMVTGKVLINGSPYIYADTGEAITTGFDINGAHYATDGRGKVLGLPKNFDLSIFKPVASVLSNLNNYVEKTVYDDDNAVMPTAAAPGTEQ